MERVRQASRLDLVVGEHIWLRPAGTGQYKGSCPFHEERFASLVVAPAVHGGRYHCFGCAADGGVLRLRHGHPSRDLRARRCLPRHTAGIDL
ncbi:CHC2 zinc finger domain-containing protein [Nakamurella sp.]|uniref:CHC2 zinc finger domain-containing protein n=1 Tax=Nakamurella sp. TaxID=1869182 RepID=UPI003B3ADFAA